MNKISETLNFTGDLIDSLVNGDGIANSKEEAEKFREDIRVIVRGGVALTSGVVAYFSMPEGGSFMQDAMGAIAVGGTSYLSAVFAAVATAAVTAPSSVIAKHCGLLDKKWV